jgi:hypothetical protein
MDIVRETRPDTAIDLDQTPRYRRRTAFGQLRLQAERRRRRANLFVVVSLVGIAALAATFALLAR